eukprot:m.515799 g.515799  ORF g.515799 m.515799 type:complete len:983 (+) comp57463_c0_seq46:194-3142(+)
MADDGGALHSTPARAPPPFTDPLTPAAAPATPHSPRPRLLAHSTSADKPLPVAVRSPVQRRRRKISRRLSVSESSVDDDPPLPFPAPPPAAPIERAEGLIAETSFGASAPATVVTEPVLLAVETRFSSPALSPTSALPLPMVELVDFTRSGQDSSLPTQPRHSMSRESSCSDDSDNVFKRRRDDSGNYLLGEEESVSLFPSLVRRSSWHGSDPDPVVRPAEKQNITTSLSDHELETQQQQQRIGPHDPLHASFVNARVVAKRQMSQVELFCDLATIDWFRDFKRSWKEQQETLKQSQLAFSSSHQLVVTSLLRFLHSARMVFLLLFISVTAGVLAGLIDISTSWLADLRLGICLKAFYLSREQCCWVESSSDDPKCDSWMPWSRLMGVLGWSEYLIDYLAYVVISVVFAATSAHLIAYFAPHAFGSGIPEMRVILSGFVIKGYLNFWTCVVKCISVILAVGSGLSMGKEGPMVHITCCIGHFISDLFKEYRTNESRQRDIVSVTAALGVAVAFGAPIGGVLFSFETLSYYFPHHVMWKSFLSAMIGSLVLANMNPLRNGADSYLFAITYRRPWQWFELVPFGAIGVFGGLFGAMFCKLTRKWCEFRVKKRLNKMPIREVAVVAFVTALFAFPSSFTRPEGSYVVSLLFQECTPGSDWQVCSADVKRGTIALLFAASVFKMIVSILTFGLAIPTDVFLPAMVIGATMGRVVGVVVEIIVEDPRQTSSYLGQVCPVRSLCVTPGLYAIVGAAAVVSGVTRMTVSLTVIFFELTGAQEYILPFMFAATISKLAADSLGKESIFDIHIKMNGYPFLDLKEDYAINTRVYQAMHPRPRMSEQLHVVSATDTLSHITELLKQSSVLGFPVVTSAREMFPLGFIDRCHLESRLNEQAPSLLLRTPAEEIVCSFDQPQSLPASQISFADLVYTSPFEVSYDTPMVMVIELFKNMGMRFVFALRNGKLVGILTKKDTLRHIALMNSRSPWS